MGEAASYCYAQEMGISWGEADDILYGDRREKPCCPLCGKKFGAPASVLKHLESGFHKPTDKLAAALAALPKGGSHE